MKWSLAILTVVVGIFLSTTGTALAKPHSGLPPHYRGWECIHAHEAQVAGWYANTGNGYYGGLQMTWGWMGVVNGGANNYTSAQQMWLAETVSAQHDFSWSWMAGQWPNSFPPCSGLFH